jgi:hypothetical protein
VQAAMIAKVKTSRSWYFKILIIIAHNAALNGVPAPRAGQGELARPCREPAGAGSNCVKRDVLERSVIPY